MELQAIETRIKNLQRDAEKLLTDINQEVKSFPAFQNKPYLNIAYEHLREASMYLGQAHRYIQKETK